MALGALARRAHVPLWIALGGAGFVGVLTAVQARINGQLGLRPGRRLRRRASISFGSGLVILIVLCAALPVGRPGVAPLVDGRARTRDSRGGCWRAAPPARSPSPRRASRSASSASRCSRSASSRGRPCADSSSTASATVRPASSPSPMPRLVGGALALVAVVLSLVGRRASRGSPAVDAGAAVPRRRRHRVAAGDERAAASARRHAADGDARQLRRRHDRCSSSPRLVHVAHRRRAASRSRPSPGSTSAARSASLYIFMSAALVAHTGVLLLGARRRRGPAARRRSPSTRCGRRRRVRARPGGARWSTVALSSVVVAVARRGAGARRA